MQLQPDANLAQLLARVDTLKDEIENLRPLDRDQEARVFQKFRLEWNFNSNAIEGNQLSMGETEMFLLHGLTSKGKPFKDYLDIRGHNDAVNFLLDLVRDKSPLNEVVIRELHKILLIEPYMVKAITPDGEPTRKEIKLGEYKTQPNHVRTQTGAIHRYASPEETPAKMGDLMGWIRSPEAQQLHPVVRGAIFHHKFTAIHPFDDGNGRLGRLLLNLMLMQCGLPPVIIRAAHRDEYIFALVKGDQNDLSEIAALVAREEVKSLELLLKGARGEAIEEADDIDKEIALLKQKLQHIQDPLVLTLELQQELYAQTFLPFFERLLRKLSGFDQFYSQTDKRITAVKQDTQTGATLEFGENQIDHVLQRLKDMSKQHILPAVALYIYWKKFMKAPLKEHNDSLQINFEFASLRYRAWNDDGLIYEHVYQDVMSEEEIRGIISRLCKQRLQVIERLIALSDETTPDQGQGPITILP